MTLCSKLSGLDYNLTCCTLSARAVSLKGLSAPGLLKYALILNLVPSEHHVNTSTPWTGGFPPDQSQGVFKLWAVLELPLSVLQISRTFSLLRL